MKTLSTFQMLFCPWNYGWGFWYKWRLSPIGALLRLFTSYVPEEEIVDPLDNPDATWSVVLKPDISVDQRKLLKEGNKLFRACGFSGDHVQNGLAGFQGAINNGDYWDVWDHFHIQGLSTDDRKELIKMVKASGCWSIHYDQYESELRHAKEMASYRARREAIEKEVQESVDNVARFLEDDADAA